MAVHSLSNGYELDDYEKMNGTKIDIKPFENEA